MKKISFVFLLISVNAKAAKMCVEDTQENIDIVETYVPDAEEWLRQAWAGKVNNRRETLIKEEIQYSLEHQIAIPADRDQILKKGMKRMGTRKERDKKQGE